MNDRPNMSYGIREPSNEEVIECFGSYASAVEYTGGSAALVLFYIKNPSYPKASKVPQDESRYARNLIALAKAEQKDANEANCAKRAKEVWVCLATAGQRTTITAVAESMGVGPRLARRYLVSAGVVL